MRPRQVYRRIYVGELKEKEKFETGVCFLSRSVYKIKKNMFFFGCDEIFPFKNILETTDLKVSPSGISFTLDVVLKTSFNS